MYKVHDDSLCDLRAILSGREVCVLSFAVNVIAQFCELIIFLAVMRHPY